MPRYEEPFDDVQKIFDDIITLKEIDRFVTVKVLADDNQKQIGKMNKANAFVQHLAGVDIIIVINQRIFEQLTPEQQNMQAEELLAGISWDNDRDRLVVNKPDINTFSGLLSRYGYKQYEVLQESIRTLYAAAEEEDAN